MKNVFVRITVAMACVFALCSCEEFGPVFTGDYDQPQEFTPCTDEDFADQTFISIKDLKAMYTVGKPFVVEDDLVIKGQVISSDRDGNFYRSFFIQDETSGIEIKIGKTGLYNTYKLGQWIYVKCKGLTVGSSNGMINIGYEDITGKYETSYIDVQLIIDNHIFRGVFDDPVEPIVLTQASQVLSKEYVGMYVTLQGLTYGDRVFFIYYRKDGSSVYVNDATGADSWAFSEDGLRDYLLNYVVDSEGDTQAQLKDYDISPISVSQYFNFGNKDVDVQVRTSGYSRFADSKLEASGIDASSAGKISLTGVMTVYNDNYQFVLNDLDGVSVAE